MQIFGDKKINAFGLDISDASIKILQLKTVKKQPQIQAYSSIPFGDKIINNHMIINEKRLAESVTKAVAAAKNIDTPYVVCSIPEIKSFVRTIRIPKMDESEIDGALPYELEQDIPVPIEQVYMDWQLIEETADSLDLLVSAAPKDYIDSLIATLRMAKLKPIAMELESFATARALVGAENLSKEVLVVDLSTTQANFIVVQKGVIQYTSSTPIAGNALTASIAKTLGVSAEEAEKLKRQTGLSDTPEGAKIKPALLPILDSLIQETRNVMQFFEDHYSHGGSIDAILFCGGGAKLKGLVEYASANLQPKAPQPAAGPGSAQPSQFTVGLGNPWINLPQLTGNPLAAQDSLEYVTAAGLALRGMEYETH